MYKFVWVFCFYVLWHSVVGDDTYSLYTKLGGRTSLFLTSQRMPSRYSECKWAHLRNQKLSLRRISSKYHRKFRWWLSLDEISYGYRCIVRLAPKIFHLSVSHRKFFANFNKNMINGKHQFFCFYELYDVVNANRIAAREKRKIYLIKRRKYAW